MNAPGAHTELPGPGLKACSKCKMAKPLVEYFKDKSKPDSLYSQVGLQYPGFTQDWPYACLCEACCTQQHRLTALIDFEGTAWSTSPPLLSVTLPTGLHLQHHAEGMPLQAPNCHVWLHTVKVVRHFQWPTDSWCMSWYTSC